MSFVSLIVCLRVNSHDGTTTGRTSVVVGNADQTYVACAHTSSHICHYNMVHGCSIVVYMSA